MLTDQRLSEKDGSYELLVFMVHHYHLRPAACGKGKKAPSGKDSKEKSN